MMSGAHDEQRLNVCVHAACKCRQVAKRSRYSIPCHVKMTSCKFMPGMKFAIALKQACAWLGQVGIGDAAGKTVNVAWNGAGMGDADYLAAFHHVLLPIAQQFAPTLIIVSAGFDAAAGAAHSPPPRAGLATSRVLPRPCAVDRVNVHIAAHHLQSTVDSLRVPVSSQELHRWGRVATPPVGKGSSTRLYWWSQNALRGA